MQKIKINDNLSLGGENPCFIIAEAGVNHNGSLELAKKLVDAAKAAGADAVKFQTFNSEDLVSKEADMATYQKKNTGKNETQLQMLKNLELKKYDFEELKKYCDMTGILFLSTPHTEDSLGFLDKLMPLFKIGSGDLTNLPFLERVAKKGKPVILSTGMANLEEIREAYDTVKKYNDRIVILHCTTSYPCPKSQVNLNAMITLKNEFGCLVGYSDHTSGIEVSLMAASLGASVIEKHFTLDKNMEGPDHKSSIDPMELKELVSRIRDHDYPALDKTVLGRKDKKPTKDENEISKLVRKSIFASKDIPAGKIINKEMLIVKRPGTGISPKYFDTLIGRTTKRAIKKDSLIDINDLNNDSPKIFVASFNRASDGAISLLLKKMQKEGMLAEDHKKSEFILAVGDRIETFDFVLERFRENKRIIHLWAGEISQGTHDEVYRHAMTIMSEMQLCTNNEAKDRVVSLCKAIDKKPDAYVVGNLMLDNMVIDKSKVPREKYDLVLYNPPTELSKTEIEEEIGQIRSILGKKYIWIEPNGDSGSELIKKYVTDHNFPRNEFLGLISCCDRFITNSSCMYYEAPFLIKKEQIIPIGKRNINRESKHSDMCIRNASDNIIEIFRGLK